jgi:hypothetical protein
MNLNEFIKKLESKKIKNGTKFEVYLGKDNFVCRVAVIGTRVAVLGFQNIPKDLYTNNQYFFKEI